jgi:hypothetical protein
LIFSYIREGIKITGFPTIHNSDTDDAPALEIIISAAAYNKIHSFKKRQPEHTFELYFLYSSKYNFRIARLSEHLV